MSCRAKRLYSWSGSQNALGVSEWFGYQLGSMQLKLRGQPTRSPRSTQKFSYIFAISGERLIRSLLGIQTISPLDWGKSSVPAGMFRIAKHPMPWMGEGRSLIHTL